MMAAVAVGVLSATALWSPKADAVEAPKGAMVVGSITSQPIGHYDFCKRNFDECDRRVTPALAPKVTDHGWDVVRQVNLAVNHAIVPMTDDEMHGVEERWSYPQTVGDCEDYVLLKQLMLIERGFSANDLLITVVRKRDGEGHAVLTLRTSEGDFVLDNLDDRVRLWTDTPYIYLKRQATFHSGRWVSIDYGSDLPVGALD